MATHGTTRQRVAGSTRGVMQLSSSALQPVTLQERCNCSCACYRAAMHTGKGCEDMWRLMGCKTYHNCACPAPGCGRGASVHKAHAAESLLISTTGSGEAPCLCPQCHTV